MPIYEFKCEEGHLFDRYLPLAEYKSPQVCECGKAAIKLISRPNIAPIFVPYQSPITGEMIETKHARTEDLKKSNCVPYETGLIEESQKRVKREEQKLDAEIGTTVERVIETMSPKQRENLENELKCDVEINCERIPA